MNTKVNLEIKKEDRKKFGGFILILIASFIGGGLLGGTLAMCDSIGIVDAVVKPALQIFMRASVYANLALSIVVIIAVAAIYMSAGKMAKAWDQEDDAVFSKINYRLGVGLMITSIAQIVMFCFFSAGILEMEQNSELYTHNIAAHAAFWVGFVGLQAAIIIAQQKIVNLTKMICPEKRGSIFDLKFQKEWLNSCDEAEKATVYEASFYSYKMVIKVCMVLWIICTLGIMFSGAGLDAVMMVTIIWLSSTISYCVKSMQLEKKH